MKKNLAIAYSGTSTQIAIAYGVAHGLYDSGIMPDLYEGCSGGDIVKALHASERFDEDVLQMILDFQLSDVFNKPPVKANGKMSATAIFRGLTMRKSLGEQRALTKTFKKYFTPDDLAYIKSKRRHLYSTITSYGYRKALHVRNSRNNYEAMVSNVMASGRIPVFTEGFDMKLDKGHDVWFDGGVLDHNGGKYFAKRKDVKTLITVWSRPEENPESPSFIPWKQKNWFDTNLKTHNVRSHGISIEDENHIDLLCYVNGVNHIKIMPNKDFQEETYRFDRDNNIRMYEHGYEIAVAKAQRIRDLHGIK